MVEVVDGQSYEFFYDYDTDGNLNTLRYPNNLEIAHGYDSYGYGYTQWIRRQSDGQLIWQYADEDEFGHVTAYNLGNTNVIRDYDPLSGLPEYHSHSVIEYGYDFNNATGNLSSRTNMSYGLQEDFDYDNLDRLTRRTMVGNPNTFDVDFSASGDITFKTDVGDYTNLSNGQTTDIINNPGTISDDPQEIGYTPFHSVVTIAEGAFDAELVYGADEQRRKMIIRQDGDVNVERYYLGGGLYEIDIRNGQPKNYAYVSTPTGLEAVYIEEAGTEDYALHLLTRDYLGSILAVLDEGGGLLEEYSYDAWGNRRDPETWVNTYNPGQNNNLFTGLMYRGFTGHEHLDWFGIINMNGRIYDPLTGRMMSADNYVQDPLFSQSQNRYAYAYNNPSKFVDPSGEIILFAALFFTEVGYDIQKYVSPIAIKFDISFGSHQKGFGVRTSIGIPQAAPISFRVHGGVGYYSKNYSVTPGWQTTHGVEWGFGGIATVGSTRYNNPGDEFDQTLGHIRLGNPIANIKYENDYLFDWNIPLGPNPDGGDRFRTAAVKLRFANITVGINLFTGDPGLNPDDREDNGEFYLPNANGDNPDKYRAGVAYLGIGPFRFGGDSEGIRHTFQNRLAHDFLRPGTPHFRELDRTNKFFFQFGSGGGFLW